MLGLFHYLHMNRGPWGKDENAFRVTRQNEKTPLAFFRAPFD